MPNGLLTCLSMTLLLEALCHLLTFASFVTLCAIVSNWPASNQAKRIVCRTVSRFPISSWETLSRTPSANLLRRYWINFWKIPQILPLTLSLSFTKVWKRNFRNSVTPLTVISLRNRLANSRWSKLTMKTLNPGKQSLKNSFLRSPLPISRNLPFFKLLLVSAVLSLPSESFPKSVPIWRLFLRRNTCAHGLGLHQPTMKAQGRKNLSGCPRPDATSNRF